MKPVNHSRFLLSAGALLGMLAVILGAMGSHLLKQVLSPAYFSAFNTAVYYQFFHTFLLLFLGLVTGRNSNTNMKPFIISGYLAFGGILLFSGSIYVLVLTGATFFGPVTPIGGILLISAWLVLFCGIIFRKQTL